MANKKISFLALVFLTGSALVGADFFVLFFFGHSFSVLITRFCPLAVVFVVVYSIVLGLNAKCFSPDFFRNCMENEYVVRLKKIGGVPIKLIGLNVVLHALFLGGIFFRKGFLGIDPAISTFLFLAMFSFGILAGTFVYVMSDGLVFRALLAHNLTSYPRELREKRQELKFFIVPIVVSLMSLLFGCAIAFLGLSHAGGMLDAISEAGWSAVQIPMTVYFICVIAMALALKKNLSRFYSSIVEQMENLSSERKDLTRRISVCSVDELGTISGMVNAFCEHLGEGIRDIKSGQKVLSDVGHRLEENASGMADSITRVSGASEQVLTKTQSQMESVNMSSQAVHQISDHIKALDESIAVQTSSMSQASAAVEEMVENISSIGSVTEKMASQFQTVEEAAEEGSRIQRESAERIHAIVEQSQALQEANRIIATIAAQTNLLAMNAAIEAAHAGETGRGFSVVSDEIRKLAENSSNESQKISAELKQIVGTINFIVKDAEASGRAFAEVSRRINETEKLVVQVDNAIREQKTGAGQVMESLRVMNEHTGNVSDGSQKMNIGSESMLQEIGTLQGSAGEIKTSMEEMSGGIRNINVSAREVSDLAVSARSSIQKISTIADEFEV
ncbi:MAG: methyl-accepting chemotaxis protein [Treponema sp.]|nr:methyl-accepting chemotaxis protein [Treponema sp.]